MHVLWKNNEGVERSQGFPFHSAALSQIYPLPESRPRPAPPEEWTEVCILQQ